VSAEPEDRVQRFSLFDRLASLVAVVRSDGHFAFVNAALEDVLGRPRAALQGMRLQDYLQDARELEQALGSVRHNTFSRMRFDATLAHPDMAEPMLVHVLVAQPVQYAADEQKNLAEKPDTASHQAEIQAAIQAAMPPCNEEIVVELIPIDLQVRLAREAHQTGLSEANKELVRNLAHEIKNPLGGIRGAAQLLEMELADKGPPGQGMPGQAKDMREYTQVIIHEADRLQALVDRLLAPHRHARVVGAVNIHEVCERVRALILAEFPQGLAVVRDYDTSLPELHGDRQQLIQAVLNIAHNAAQALAGRIAAGDARITLRTRVARQVTLGKRRHKLALQLLIQDNGPGVPDAIKERVFFPLVSGREGGVGLGLTLAQSFVQQHDGMIDLDSEPGRTAFRILIPLQA
jgi:two-component system nitrogen regulation sensor histidine kinase GlnL